MYIYIEYNILDILDSDYLNKDSDEANNSNFYNVFFSSMTFMGLIIIHYIMQLFERRASLGVFQFKGVP